MAKKPKRFSDIRSKTRPGETPAGMYSDGITNAEFAGAFGRMASLWPLVEEKMIEVMTELLGGDYDLPARQIFRSIVAAQARVKVLRSLLERTELNERKDSIYDEVIDEFSSLNDARNKLLHGLWYTHESGRVFLIENSIDNVSLFHAREMSLAEVLQLVTRMVTLQSRVDDIVDGEYDIRQANST